MTRVVIAGDRDLTLPGLNGMRVRDGEVEVVGTVPTGREALDLCRTLQPNLVILDLREPGIDGLETTQKIKEIDRSIKVVFLTTSHHPPYVWAVMAAGADAYLYRSTSPSDVLESIRQVMYHETFLSCEVLARFMRWVNDGGETPEDGIQHRFGRGQSSLSLIGSQPSSPS